MSDRRVYKEAGGTNPKTWYEIDGLVVSQEEYYADRVPAVSPDNDYEDTLARFSGLNVTLPYPGYEGRPVVEDFAEPVSAHDAQQGFQIRFLAFFMLGVGIGIALTMMFG